MRFYNIAGWALTTCALILFYPVTSRFQEFGFLEMALVFLAARMCWDKDAELRKTDMKKGSRRPDGKV